MIIEGDCLEVMKGFADNQFDLVLTDPPYGKTNLDWDNRVDFMGEALRVAPAVIVTATQPYASQLIIDNLKDFKYDIIWEKSRISNPLRNKKEPSRVHEQILVFGNPVYNPQTFTIDEKYIDKRNSINDANWGKGQFKGKMTRKKDTGVRQPQSVIYFPSHWSAGMHPTQKPLKLFEYLIRTYSNEGDGILDPFAGSGTTLEAAYNTKRNCTVIEVNPEYIEIIKKRERQEVLL